jgi:hypothetical protein
MLINIRISELQNYTKNSILLGLIITIFLSYSIFQVLPYSLGVINNYSTNINNVLSNIFINKDNKDLSVNNDLYFASSND